eukprot:m.126877 g.126877  ORF g.126877 m.126877 type:complete len:229 (-) comp13585_c0_seq4:238-924(-)
MGSGVSKAEHFEVVQVAEQKEQELNHVQSEHEKVREEHGRLLEEVQKERKQAVLERQSSQKHMTELEDDLNKKTRTVEDLSAQLAERDRAVYNASLETEMCCAVLNGLTISDNMHGEHIPSVDELVASHGTEANGYGLEDDYRGSSEALSPELYAALTAMQGRYAAMHAQLVLAQKKVAQQHRELEDSKELILQQRKQILTVENRNEKLRHEDPIKRLLKQRRSTNAL